MNLTGSHETSSVEATYSYAITTQRKARNGPSRGLWEPSAVSLWYERAGVSNITNHIFTLKIINNNLRRITAGSAPSRI